jgi:hypothetical protein
MLTQFTLSKDEVSKLASFEAHGKDIIANATSICLPDITNNKLDILFLGGSDELSAKFSLNIANASTDIPVTDLNFYLTDVAEFAVMANKVIKGADSITVKVSGDNTTATYIKNEVNQTEIAIVNHDKLTENKVKRIIQSFKDYQNCFTNGKTYTITPSPEFIDVMGMICRSMKASGYELNSAMINHQVITYCDPQGILSYTLKDDISPYDKDIYIQDILVKHMSSFSKDGIILTLDETNTYAKLEIPDRLLIVMALPENIFQYPSKEEIDIVAPDPNSCISIKVNKAALLEALGTFDGVFRSEIWKWSSLVLDSSKQYLDEGKIFFSHGDSNARACTYLPVELLSKTEQKDECRFLIGSTYLKDILARMPNDDITITYSSEAIGTPHGTGFTVSDGIFEVICIKIIDSDA